ncbi:anti-sigma factor [Neobacillus notoginsengisoli]|uniref:Anti-sigma factor n=1 Tax=Neobacillus notoginsengisoli TaxID=1578198 RepID=A0A417YZH7_9BACI|nr:anti-sigma factor [Neobacillus notoginsengisoli]RHW43300.1 anti-sigma factor [Neobacillus notoginsengisoli]
MTNQKDFKNMYDLAEKIALEDFEKLDEQHEFSDTYKYKKKLFLEKIKAKNGQQLAKRKKNRILIAAACLLIGIPTTALGAVKVYDMMVQKQNYEVNVSVTNSAKNNDKWYKLKLNYLPENMVPIDSSGMKYSFKDNFANGGFSFILWRLGKNSEFQTLYSSKYEEKEINGRKAVIVNKETGNPNVVFNRKVYLLFEKEGIMLESFIANDVSEEQMMNVLENLSIEPTSEEFASYFADYDESYFEEVSKPVESKVIPLKKDSKQLFKVGQKVPVTFNQVDSDGKSKNIKLEYMIEKVEIFDSIQDINQENFNELGLNILKQSKVLDDKKNLLSYKRNEYEVGNGKDSIDELVKSKKVNVKFVYLTTTVKNIGKQATEEIYMHPSLQELKSDQKGWNYAGKVGIAEESIMTGEVDYLEPHGTGKSFYNIGLIQPGETREVKLGYFVDEDKLDSIFLDAFNYSGSGENEDLNSKNHWWIDIRQK